MNMFPREPAPVIIDTCRLQMRYSIREALNCRKMAQSFPIGDPFMDKWQHLQNEQRRHFRWAREDLRVLLDDRRRNDADNQV